jgi:tRNA-dihydrouridine synthase
VVVTGGLSDAARVREAFELTGAAAVMLARGALGNPWLFQALLAGRRAGPTLAEVAEELCWTIECAVEHLGEARATRYLRKFYPWYVARLELDGTATRRLQEDLQRAPTLERVGELLDLAIGPVAAFPPAPSPRADGAPLYCCAR